MKITREKDKEYVWVITTWYEKLAFAYGMFTLAIIVFSFLMGMALGFIGQLLV